MSLFSRFTRRRLPIRNGVGLFTECFVKISGFGGYCCTFARISVNPSTRFDLSLIFPAHFPYFGMFCPVCLYHVFARKISRFPSNRARFSKFFVFSTEEICLCTGSARYFRRTFCVFGLIALCVCTTRLHGQTRFSSVFRDGSHCLALFIVLLGQQRREGP